MGWRPAGTRKDFDRVKAIPVEQFPGAPHYQYAPLASDSDAMALLKKFDIVIEREKDRTLFAATLFKPVKGRRAEVHIARAAATLNQAICECVAKMQLQSPPQGMP